MKIIIDEKYLSNYIVEQFQNNKIDSVNFSRNLYHHNSGYSKAPTILKHGILSIRKLNNLGIIQLSEKQLQIFDDNYSHVNGLDGVSLSLVGLDDLYKDEFEYNPFSSDSLDFLISNSIIARRSTQHYGNEFVTYEDVLVNKIKSLDFRLINLIKKDSISSEELIDKYNMIIKIAYEIEKRNLKIKMREMSNNQINLNVKKLSKLPLLVKCKQ